MTVATHRLSESLQALIDARLDTIDRMLLGRVPRADRLAIARDVEAQVYDLLEGPDPEALTREDVLAALARLDPPEAYLSEESGALGVAVPAAPPHRVRPATRREGDPNLGRASGIVGLVALALALLGPLNVLAAEWFGSLLLFYCGSIILAGLVLMGGIVGTVLGLCARLRGAWAILGLVTGLLALLLLVVEGVGLMMIIG